MFLYSNLHTKSALEATSIIEKKVQETFLKNVAFTVTVLTWSLANVILICEKNMETCKTFHVV